MIDFKTGNNTKKLNARELEEGSGLQVILYALALRSLGVEDVKAGLVGPNLSFDDSFDITSTQTAHRIWKHLCQMQRTGIFGMTEELRKEFSFTTPLPIATLPIDPQILELKSKLPTGKSLKRGANEH